MVCITSKQESILRWNEYITTLARLLSDADIRISIGDVWNETDRDSLRSFRAVLSAGVEISEIAKKHLNNMKEGA